MSDVPTDTQTQDVQSTPTVTQPTEPTAIDLNDDALIRVKGSDKPVKFGDHVRGFQSQFTKASQEAARLKKELADREARIQRYEQAQRQAQQNQSQGQQQDVYASLRSLPYLTGQDAVGVVESISGQLQQRDQILLQALKRMQAMEQRLGGLHENHVNQSFDAKINQWLKEGGYPTDPAVTELAKEVYLAYTGDDLDEEFPQIFKNRWDSVTKVFESQRQQKIQANKRQPFIPGKGSTVGPSKPLEIKPDANARDIAEQLWGSWRNEEET